MFIFFFQYRQIQAQIMKMSIYLTQNRQIQAGSDHENVHIFAKYRQIQANMNSPKSAYVPVCECADHENVHIYFAIQANTGSDHENVHIFDTIQAYTGRIRS